MHIEARRFPCTFRLQQPLPLIHQVILRAGVLEDSLLKLTEYTLFSPKRLVFELKIEQKLSTFVQIEFDPILLGALHTETLPTAIRFPANKPQVYTTRADENVIVMGVLTVQ